MERSVWGKKNLHLQYDLFQSSNLFGNKMKYFIIYINLSWNIIFHYQKDSFHCRSERNLFVNENFSWIKRIVPLQKVQLAALSETEHFRIFLSVNLKLISLVFFFSFLNKLSESVASLLTSYHDENFIESYVNAFLMISVSMNYSWFFCF